MKILNVRTMQDTKTVKYFGNDLVILSNEFYLAVDSDSSLYAYGERPSLSIDDGSWGYDGEDYRRVGDVNLEGIEWDESLVSI